MATLRELYPIESTKPLKKTIQMTIKMFFALIFVLIYAFFASLGKTAGSPISSGIFYVILGAGISIIMLIIILKYIYEVFYMKSYFYDVNGKTIVIRKGVFSRNEINLPFNRLQDVYVDQDFLDRIFGLYDVHVSSATSVSESLSHIDGVNKENSEALKKLFLEAIHEKNS